MKAAPLVVVNAVGLTGRLLEHAPRLASLATKSWWRPVREVVPAVTSTAQATLLTGKNAQGHGIVANGWLFRDTMEVRFWQQSNRLLEAEPIYTTARRIAAERGEPFRCAKLFWWFNQGADVDISVTPKPRYGCDGNKIFGISGTPVGLAEEIERALGPFPFPAFWGPMAGLAATEWIAACAAWVLKRETPDLTLVYLPHLDYEPQKHGPSGCDMRKAVAELDGAAAPLLDAADRVGARVVVVSEYGHCDVTGPEYLNRALREAGYLVARDGPFGEMLDTFESRAFAACDHQFAHVYVREREDIAGVRAVLASLPGVERLLVGVERDAVGLDHPRSGEIVALARRDRWFAYPYWIDDEHAPDFARTVDIHRKCGFDPCEMFFDRDLWWPKGRAALRLLQKKLGFRTRFDVISLDASLVRGSHGLAAADPLDRPILIGTGERPENELSMTDVRDYLLDELFPGRAVI